MKKKSVGIKLRLCAMATAIAFTLSACSTTSVTEKNVSAFGPLTLNLQDYEKAYAESSSRNRFDNLILLTRAQIATNNTESAIKSIDELFALAKTDLQKDELSLIHAQLLQKQGQYNDALHVLSSVNYNAMPASDVIYFLKLNQNVNNSLFEKTKDVKYQITAFKSESALLKYATRTQDKQKILDKSLSLLKAIDDTTLSSCLSNVKNDEDRGFYEYAIIDKSENTLLKEQLINSFMEKYPLHPLTLIKQQGITAVDSRTPQEALSARAQPAESAIFNFVDGDQIAVLLPLSGRFAKTIGEPARMGILSALKDRQSKSKVIFYDTNKTNISSIVSTVNGNSTTLVIGPILKPEVNALNQNGLKKPSIVLNAPEGNKPKNQWYFDLGPNYEGAVAASKIYVDGYKNPLVILKNGDNNSQRALQGFASNFAKVNINPVTCGYTSSTSLKTDLSSCPLNSADAVYINADAVDAVQIKGLIPSNIKVYLTDKSYLGVNNSSQEFALKGALLGDMPWVLTDSPLKDSFLKSMPKANSQVQKIFSAAYDSVNFAYSINALSQNRNDVLHGLSGDISLGENGLIESTPIWVELGVLR